MEATGLTLRNGAVGNQPCRRRFQAATLLGPLAWSLAVVLALCGGWLLLRRLTGAFTKPLPDVVLLSAGMCAVVCAAAARLLWRRAAGENSVSVWRVRDWLPTVALVFVATSAAVPGSSVTVIVLLWVMIAAEEVAAAWLGRMRRGAGRHRSIALYHRSGERPEILPPQSDPRATQRGGYGQRCLATLHATACVQRTRIRSRDVLCQLRGWSTDCDRASRFLSDAGGSSANHSRGA